MKKIILATAFVATAFTANAQNIIKNGDFSTEVNTETVNKTPASTDWFFFDKTEGKTTFANVKDDNAHGNAVQIENTSDNSWYRSYVGQRVQGAEKGIYTLTFDMKALTPKTQVRVFLKSANNDKMFFLREGFDINDETTKKQSAAAFSRAEKKLDKWVKVTAKFDLSKAVNNFASPQGVEAKGGKINVTDASEDMIKDFVVVIQLQNKDTKALIDNVSLLKK